VIGAAEKRPLQVVPSQDLEARENPARLTHLRARDHTSGDSDGGARDPEDGQCLRPRTGAGGLGAWLALCVPAGKPLLLPPAVLAAIEW
jgi:hypothetical protein